MGATSASERGPFTFPPFLTPGPVSTAAAVVRSGPVSSASSPPRALGVAFRPVSVVTTRVVEPFRVGSASMAALRRWIPRSATPSAPS